MLVGRPVSRATAPGRVRYHWGRPNSLPTEPFDTPVIHARRACYLRILHQR